MKWWKGDIAPFVLASMVLAYGVYYLRTAAEWHFIDAVDLTIHETGHLVFMPFGELLTILGGSLFQILMPAVFAVYFWLRKDMFAAALTTVWVGFNIASVSVYAGDAVAMQLPLITGDTLGHDWHNALSMVGVLQYTHAIASSIYIISVAVILGGGIAGVYFSQRSSV